MELHTKFVRHQELGFHTYLKVPKFDSAEEPVAWFMTKLVKF